MAIRDKHGRVGQGKPGFPHFADALLSYRPRPQTAAVSLFYPEFIYPTALIGYATLSNY